MVKIKIEKKNYWLVGGSIAVIINIIILFLINYFLTKGEECFECIVLGIFARFPCLIVDINSILCTIISLLVYFIIGALLGLFISKLKK